MTSGIIGAYIWIGLFSVIIIVTIFALGVAGFKLVKRRYKRRRRKHLRLIK